MAWAEISRIASATSAGKTPGTDMKAEAISAPTTFATSTTLQSRAIDRPQRSDRRATTGSTVVMVFSVNNCIRPRITTMKPSE